MQRSSSSASQALEEIYPQLKMQRSASGNRLEEIYPKIFIGRPTSQMSQPRSVSQLSAADHEIYPNLIRAQRGSTPLDESMYPRVLANNGKLIQVPVSQLSQQQIDEIYPKLLKQQLNSSVQLSQLPG